MKELDHYAKLLELGKISRREFIGRAMALGATTALATTMAGKALEAATPQRGGHLRVGSEGGSNTDSMDPRLAIGTNQITAGILSVYDTLTGIGADGAPYGALAESWESSDDAKTWRFKIRKGVEFHNGKTLDVNDVLSSYAYEDNDANTHGDSRTIMASITERKADGDTLVLTLETANADLPTLLAAYGLLIGPAGTEGKAWDQPGLGTGPFILDNFEPNVVTTVKRNPNHYRDDEGYLDSAEFLNIKDQSARSNAIRTDEVDVINRVDPKTAHLLAKTPGLELVEVAGNQHYTMPMNMGVAPYDNNDVRLAIKYAVNREEILDKILGGFGYLGNDHPIGKGQLYFNRDLAQRPLDLDKAKFPLNQAGLSTLDIELAVAETAWGGAVDAAVLVQETAKKGGINIKVNRVADDGYWSNTWMKVPWCLSYWAGRATEDWMFSTAYLSTSGWNESYMKIDRFDELLLAARGELDTDKRRVMYYEMQEIVRDEGGSVVPVFSSYLMMVKDTLGHNELASLHALDNFMIARKWWWKSA